MSKFSPQFFSPNHQFYFNNSNFPSQSNYRSKIVGIFMGQCGDGKTTMINRLCKTDFESDVSMESLTRQIQIGKCSYCPNFVLLDTPGTSSKLQIKKHAMLLKTSLQLQPINAIFILSKFESRASDTIDNFIDLMSLVKNYEKNVVLLVSKFDTCPDKSKEKYLKMFLQEFQKKGLKNPVIFFSNNEGLLETPIQKLADAIFNIAASYPKVSIKISKQEFYKSFTKTSKAMRKDNTFDEEKIKKMFKICLKYAQSLPHNFEKALIIEQLITYARNQLEKYSNEFYLRVTEGQDQQKCYSVFLSISSINFYLMDNFIIETNNILGRGFKYFQFRGTDKEDESDPRNMIRVCPHCQTAWMKTDGCRNNTTCGNRSTFFDDLGKYEFRIQNESLKVQKKSYVNPKFEQQNKIWQQKNSFQKLMKVFGFVFNPATKSVGCGKTIAWVNMPVHPNAGEILKQLYPGDKLMMQNLEKFIKKDEEKMQSTFKKIELDINRTIDQNTTKALEKIKQLGE